MKSRALFDSEKTPLARGTTLIEASAGTGKTFTIARLYVRFLIEEGLRVPEILVTTYTKAATAELRDRIRRAVHEALAAATDEMTRERLSQALRDFDEAAIYTIHGFCQRMLQDRAFESGLPFSAELAEDQSAVLREVAEDFWRQETYQREPVLTALALLAKLSPQSLHKLLEETVGKPHLAVLPAAGRLTALQANITTLFADARELWARDQTAIERHFSEAVSWASGATKHGKPATMKKALGDLGACLSELGAALEMFEQFDLFAHARIVKATKKNQESPRHRLFELCEQFGILRAEYAVALQTQFLAWAGPELARRKLRRNELSFDDLLTRLRDALDAPGGERLAALIRSRFRAALIDEFQDTDAIQAASFRRIFAEGDGWLYLIGDPKQAIYAFRGADVFTYLSAAQRAQQSFTLGTNYRSESALVAAVNSVFNRAANVFAIERIQFRPATAAGAQAQTPLRVQGRRVAPLRFWWWEEEEEAIKASVANERLPIITAAHLAQQLAGGVTIGDRPVVPKDFAVLVGTHVQAAAMQVALARFRIPGVLHSSASVFESSEAADLQAILAAVAEPARDDLLRAALATPTLGGEAAKIEALARDEHGWEDHLICFQRWHETWLHHGFIQMFRHLLQAEGVRPRLLAWPDGERRLTNLLHLGELLHQTSTRQRLSPPSLLKWLSEQRAPGAPRSEERELRLESDADAVQIVTMHKSKGLEYNIVYCPFSWRTPEARNDARVLFHPPEDEERLTLDLGTPELEENKKLAARERLAEQVRLLYVALTRARHQCHVVWGKFNAHAASAAAWVLHPPPSGADAIEEFAEHAKQLTPARMRADLEALARSAPGTIAIDELPPENAPPYRPAEVVSGVLAPRKFIGRIAHDWRIASFTSLTAAAESELPDFDQFVTAEKAEVAAAGIHAFPRGAKAGVCFHELFEHLDFRDDGAIDKMVARKLATFGFDSAEHRAAVADCVRHVLALPLAPGLTLAQIARSARLNELEFYFPFSRLEARELSQLFGPLPTGIGRVVFDAQQGFIKGFIDVVFEHDGRFYILDWKSNWLGANAEAYHATAVRAEMERHHYVLQYYLYSVALHRHLSRRVPGYDYAQHFGGVFYLFVRGVDPSRPELGVHRDLPSQGFIENLDALLARGGTA